MAGAGRPARRAAPAVSLVLLVGLAALAALAWGPARPLARRPVRAVGAPGVVGSSRARLRDVLSRARRRMGRSRAPDVGAVIGEVATRLRSGAPVEQAWRATVDRVLGPPDGADGAGGWVRPVPPSGRVRDGPGAAHAPVGAHTMSSDLLPAGLSRLAERCRGDAVAQAAVATVVAATRLSHVTGAPLADVLDRCVATVVEAERAHDDRRVALAGPRSTARILTGLPLLGLVLGAGLGADPVGVALDGGWGTASVAGGLALLYAGARWTAALVRAAEGFSGTGGRWGPHARGRAGERARRGGP